MSWKWVSWMRLNRTYFEIIFPSGASENRVVSYTRGLYLYSHTPLIYPFSLCGSLYLYAHTPFNLSLNPSFPYVVSYTRGLYLYSHTPFVAPSMIPINLSLFLWPWRRRQRSWTITHTRHRVHPAHMQLAPIWTRLKTNRPSEGVTFL